MGQMTTTEQGQAGPQSPEAQRMMQMLQQYMQQGMGQTGDLSAYARGEVGGPTEQDRASVQDAQSAAGDVARAQMEQALAEALQQVEGGLLDRGLEGSSIEAVTNALIGRDFNRQMATMLGQQRAEGAQQLVNMPFQRADVALNANQLLMQRLVQGAGVGLPYDASIRSLNASQMNSTPTSQMLLQAGSQLGQSRLGAPNLNYPKF